MVLATGEFYGRIPGVNRGPQYRHDAHRERGVRNKVTRPRESLFRPNWSNVGKANDGVTTERSRRMLNITHDTGRF